MRKELIIIFILLQSLIPISSAVVESASVLDRDMLITTFPDGVIMTVRPHTLNESGWVTVNVLDSRLPPQASAEAKSVISEVANFPSSIGFSKFRNINQTCFKIWVVTPWNGVNSSGKYDINVEYNNLTYVIDPWWNVAWQRSSQLIFDTLTTGIVDDLTDFPVMVRLNDSRIDWDDLNADGGDIRFIDADNVTVLNHEFEKWDYGVEAIIWVRVPRIDGNSTTDHIWMYYEKPGVSTNENKTGVWNAGFDMVQHMVDETTSTTLDSTINDKDGIKSSANHPNQNSSLIGYGQDFKNSNILFPPYLLSSLSGGFSVWINFNMSFIAQYGGLGYIINEDDQYKSYIGIQDADIFTGETDINSEIVVAIGGVLTIDDWYLASVSFDGYNATAYVNGVEVDTRVGLVSNTTFDRFGGFLGATAFSGLIDEARLSNVPMSISWVKGEYYTGLDEFISYDMPWTGVHITVYDEDLSVIPGAEIIIEECDHDLHVGIADSDGSYFHQLCPDDYIVFVSARGFKPYTGSMTVPDAYSHRVVILYEETGGFNPLIIVAVLMACFIVAIASKKRYN